MKKNTKEKIRSYGVAAIIIFMALMLVLAYMPMLFVPDEAEQGGVEVENETESAERTENEGPGIVR